MNKLKLEVVTKMNRILERLDLEKEGEDNESEQFNDQDKVEERESRSGEKKDVIKLKDGKELKEQTLFKCDKCDYTAKKKVTLTKHINTKHCINPKVKEIDRTEPETKVDRVDEENMIKNCDKCDGMLSCEKNNCDYKANNDKCGWCHKLYTEALCKKLLQGQKS